MANNTIHFQHPTTGQIREAPVGFSWTCFFFGFFPAFFRGDWKWGLIMMLSAPITAGLSWLIFCFFYNKIYVKELVNDGFKVKTIKVGDIKLVQTQLGVPLDALPATS